MGQHVAGWVKMGLNGPRAVRIVRLLLDVLDGFLQGKGSAYIILACHERSGRTMNGASCLTSLALK
jgi:hypothetical protein